MPDHELEVSVFSVRLKLSLGLLAFSLFLVGSANGQRLPIDPAGKLLPDKLGEYRAVTPIGSFPIEVRPGMISMALRAYASRDGRTFSAAFITTASDSIAYAEFTDTRRMFRNMQDINGNAGIGTSSLSYKLNVVHHISFFKGRVLGSCQDEGESKDLQPLSRFAAALSETLDKGEGDIPVLVKHLPDWENASRMALYTLSVQPLIAQFGEESVFSVVSFEGGVEAVVANYGSQQLVIVEFKTPQVATDQNSKITARMQELRTQGQSKPTAYRRVGNYGVFVFDAPSAEAANQLIDQVKYQQVVQWLGENPFAYERATREFTETTLGVFVAVVKTSGLALVACLAVGGFFGAMLFRLRRAQQRSREAYIDADAMLRLNLDELTPESEPARLLGPGHQ